MFDVIPERIDTLEAQVIRHVACGDSHSIALTKEGLLFAWGSNRHGQLGTGQVEVTQSRIPKLVGNVHEKVQLDDII